MKIFVAGTRGIPDIPGGVERHCQELYPRLAALGHQVILAARRPYLTGHLDHWQGVHLRAGFAPRQKSLEALVHTFGALLQARRCRPDIVHLHAVGPALLTPLARLLGLKVVVTHHGPDYRRQKWGVVARAALRLGERMGCRWANGLIAISQGIAREIRQRHGRESVLIPNGVDLPVPDAGHDFLDRLGLVPGRYLLTVARLVPEKGLHLLIEAFSRLPAARSRNFKLVLAGDADHETPYSRELKGRAGRNERLVLPGFVTGSDLEQLYSHAHLFVLPSFHEGLPIALLEAMSYGLATLVSDIPANQEVGLAAPHYFRTGDGDHLAQQLDFWLNRRLAAEERRQLRTIVAERYNWQNIAQATLTVYGQVLAHRRPLAVNRHLEAPGNR